MLEELVKRAKGVVMVSLMTGRRGLWSGLSVGVVLALAGLIFTTNARISHSQETRQPENLAQLVENESNNVDKLSITADTLSRQITLLSSANRKGGTPTKSIADLDMAMGSSPVAGPGLTVTLNDAPISVPRGKDVRPDDLVVHQQDVQAVVNALWAGGAEAMTLQGQRVTATSAFRCAGNILLLHGRVFSPPYVVQAIGDQRQMRIALDSSPQLDIYREWVDLVKLGWEVEDSKKLRLPQYEGTLELKYSHVVNKPESR